MALLAGLKLSKPGFRPGSHGMTWLKIDTLFIAVKRKMAPHCSHLLEEILIPEGGVELSPRVALPCQELYLAPYLAPHRALGFSEDKQIAHPGRDAVCLSDWNTKTIAKCQSLLKKRDGSLAEG